MSIDVAACPARLLWRGGCSAAVGHHCHHGSCAAVATEMRKVGVVGDGQGSDVHIGNNEWEPRAWKEGDDKIRASRYSTELGKPCSIYVYNMCGSNLSRKPYH
jgi:hypothetical protein